MPLNETRNEIVTHTEPLLSGLLSFIPLIIAVLVLIFCGLSVTYQTYLYQKEMRSYELDLRIHAKLIEERDQLILEQQSKGSTLEVARLATTQLHMIIPSAKEIINLSINIPKDKDRILRKEANDTIAIQPVSSTVLPTSL